MISRLGIEIDEQGEEVIKPAQNRNGQTETFQFVHRSCPTWIRTKTNRTKICRTTIILSGKLTPDLTGTATFMAFAKGVQK